MPVEMELTQVGLVPSGREGTVLLREVGGLQCLRLSLSPPDLAAVAAAAAPPHSTAGGLGQDPQELILTVAAALGASVVSVLLEAPDGAHGTPGAVGCVLVEHLATGSAGAPAGAAFDVPTASPADALALALRARAPIFADEEILAPRASMGTSGHYPERRSTGAVTRGGAPAVRALRTDRRRRPARGPVQQQPSPPAGA